MTTANMTHSPLPWVSKTDANQSRISPAWGQFRLATLESDNHQNDAAFICTAVNSHQALVEALEQLFEFWDNGTPVRPGSFAIETARAALALAKGGNKA